MTAPGALVVGVDGSPGARAALEYAIREAVGRTVPVLVVVAFEPTLTGAVATGAVPSAHDLHHAARELASAEVAAVLAGFPENETSGLDVEVQVGSGPAPAILTRLSTGAGALIVGHRGRGGIASRLIGSVSLSCVVHAETTVIVVRPPEASPHGEVVGGAVPRARLP